MAQVILGGVGAGLGGGIGQALGAAVGGALDNALIASLSPARQRGPRLEGLKIQSSAEGAPMAWAAGRARVTGQVIWAARFLESRHESRGGKGGPRTVEHAYSLSFAVAICEGPIDGVGRVWADGRPLDLSGVAMRVHRGTEDQVPDALIEAVEGTAPAYRGTAYAVFEDMPLGAFGNRPPQLSFEVFRRPRGEAPALEDQLEGVCLIPGAGEFVLATEPVNRREGLTKTASETVHSGEGRTDLVVSLDQLMAQCPNLRRVSLVVGWFGNDLRASHCEIRPGVERRDKPTEPLGWSVAGLDRAEAHLISESGGGPAYGGTPSDESVRQAVAELKARGLEVTLYPFVFMDVPADNALPDPYGGARQAAYPWRGRLKGRDGAQAADDVAAAFGAADGWGLRRLARHYAALAAETGADGLLIGSEMRGLTWTRDAGGGFPAVGALRTLAGECRAIVGAGVKLSYAADWSEYFGRHDGADAVFHLDPLWADPDIDYVGIDWYPPLTDWREGDGGLDAADFAGPADPAYLSHGLAGGEGFDWYYADAEDRAAQARTSIHDSAYGEHWLFRPKDLAGWWSNAHHDRIGGVRSATSTDWVPGLKPIRLTEFGCAAVNRGGNAPNLFQDPKSAEGALPPHSTGARDDPLQRRALEVLLGLMDDSRNPVSGVYGGRMIEAMDAWCWDARPWPAFPARADVWADAGAWRTGHWLNGRLGGEARATLEAVLARAGLEADGFEVGPVEAMLSGYVIDRPMRVRDALEPLATALGLTVSERGGRVSVEASDGTVLGLEVGALALPEDGATVKAVHKLEPAPDMARVRFIDETADYQTGAVTVRGDGSGMDGAWGGAADLDLPAVCGPALAQAAARRLLDEGAAARGLTVALDPLNALRLEPGDVVTVEGEAGTWRVARLAWDETPHAVLAPVVDLTLEDVAEDWRGGEGAGGLAAPFLRLLDLPPLPGAEDDGRPLAAVAAEPWRAMEVWAGPTVEALTLRGRIETPATVGTLVAALSPGVRHRWDRANALMVRVEGRAPESRPEAAVLAGANAVAVETAEGWEIVQYRQAELVGGDVWRLSGLLRGRQGTEDALEAGAASGAVVVWLDGAARASSPSGERGAPLIWRAGPQGWPPGGAAFAETAATLEGRHERPWRPAHLRARAEDDGLRLNWIPRRRLGGDGWGPEGAAPSGRWRVRILEGEAERRVVETEAPEWLYAEAAADWPDGLDGAVAAVCEWGEGFGWGAEARCALE